jgi:hypothetical protein
MRRGMSCFSKEILGRRFRELEAKSADIEEIKALRERCVF